jgi:hypothetical protein
VFFLPAKLKAQKKVLVIKAIALVSSPKFVKKSPNTKPKDGIDPNATTCNKKRGYKIKKQ